MFAHLSQFLGQGPQLLSYDSVGHLYAANSKNVRCFAATQAERDSLVTKRAEISQFTNFKDIKLPQELLCDPATAFSVNRVGSKAVLAGVSCQVSDCMLLACLDLSKRQGATHAGKVWHGQVQAVHTDLFSNRPGLHIWQVGWHPGSEFHFAVLTNDSFWRLYHTDDLTIPEQTFELQLGPNRSLGINLDDDKDVPARHAVGFAFGASHAWERFAVYFACCDGSAYMLCPVAPFQAALPASAVDQLLDISRHNTASSSNSTTQAWLDQALPKSVNRAPSSRSPAEQVSSAASVSSLLEGLVSVQPHALDRHVPALCGPLQPVSKKAGASKAASTESAAAILTTRYADTCSALVVGTADGTVQTLVVAGEVIPTWAEQAPACITEGRRLKAIRSEVPVLPADSDTFILRDLMALQLPSAPLQQLPHQAAAAELRLQLVPDPCMPERLYVVHAHGAYAIRLAWLPVMASYLASPDTASQLGLDLLPPVVEDLWHPTQPGQIATSAAPLGSSLQPSGLVLLDSKPEYHCLQARRVSLPDQELDDAIGVTDDGMQSSSILFADVLKGPEAMSRPVPPGGPTGAGNPEGQALLTDSINHLRRKHVEYAHAAHHDIMHGIEAVQAAAVEQQQQCEELQESLSALQAHQHDLEQRITDASQFRNNLAARLGLLAQLQMKLPEGLNAAEEQLQDTELPNLDQQAQLLSKQIQALSARARAVEQADGGTLQAGLTAMLHGCSIPPQQLGKARRAVETQQEAILKCQQKLALLMSATNES